MKDKHVWFQLVSIVHPQGIQHSSVQHSPVLMEKDITYIQGGGKTQYTCIYIYTYVIIPPIYDWFVWSLPTNTHLGTNIPFRLALLKMIFLVPRWDMLSYLELEGIKDIHSNIFNNKHGTKKISLGKGTCVIFQAPPFFWGSMWFFWDALPWVERLQKKITHLGSRASWLLSSWT